MLLRFLVCGPAPPPGTLRWAQFLSDEKSGKESLRAFPPKDLPGVRGWACVKTGFGPSPLLWLLVLPPHQATLGGWPYGRVVSMSGPTLAKRRSRRRKPGHRPLGTAAYQDKALAVEVPAFREVGILCRITSPSMWHELVQGQKEKGAPSTQYRGVDSTRRGKAPPLVVFGSFLAAERNPQRGASPPGWQA